MKTTHRQRHAQEGNRNRETNPQYDVRRTIRLTEQQEQLLHELVEERGYVSQSNVLRIGLEELAQREGVGTRNREVDQSE